MHPDEGGEGGTPTPSSRINWLLLIAIPHLCGAAITVIAVLWVLEIPSEFGLALFPQQMMASVFACALAAMFLTMPARRGASRGSVPWYDIVLAAVGFSVMVYIALHYDRLVTDAPLRTPETIIIGTIVALFTLEGLRRAAGPALFWLVLAFVVYALFAGKIPGPLQGRSIDFIKLLVYLTFDTNALLGIPMRVGATIVVCFILMGQLLFVSGGGQFFTDFAMAAIGRRRGGAAKIAVVASGLFGTISGTAVSNVASVGALTIPLMIRSGYPAVIAGAIEAVASTGGQLMPPIMGAAAFLMADFLEISYTQVMIAAILPALLYYFAVFVQADLLAARDGIKMVDSELPRVGTVMRSGWHFAIPFVVLLYALFRLQDEPEVTAIYACASIAIIGMIRGYGIHRINIRLLIKSFARTGLIVLELFMILAGAGFVIGVINVTGLGYALTLFLSNLAGSNLWLLLVMSAIVCIILGMGMPTIAVYVLLATLVAPGIIQGGVPPLAAHLFIFYLGMMSMITPPIALAAFAAAAISRAGAWETGWAAMRIGWVALIIPFVFVGDPALLMQGDALSIVTAVVASVAGVYCITLGVIGFFSAPLSFTSRAILFIAGIGAFGTLIAVPHAAWIPAGICTVFALGGLVRQRYWRPA
jgi:TRAP transporter 4TM/12TM fusion protein